MNKCKICKKKILDKEEKAVIWEKRDGGLYTYFCHIKCVPQEAEDVTKELIGPYYGE